MAKLEPTPNPKQWRRREGESMLEHREREYSLLNVLQTASNLVDIKTKDFRGFLFAFPIGDGYAYYVVTNHNPVHLYHVPFGDSYQITRPRLSGIRVTDVANHIKARDSWAKILAEPAPKTKNAARIGESGPSIPASNP